MTTKTSALRQYLDATKKQTVLLGKIERHLLTLPPDTSRRQDVLHPSEVTKDDWCIRASWFTVRGVTRDVRTNPGLRLASIYAEGHSIHHKWQKWISDVDMLVGVWECDEHGRYWGKESDHDTCEVTYKEVPVWHGDMDIAGHADGWVTSGHLLEIKSIGIGTIRAAGLPVGGGLEEAFRGLSRPINSHIRQASLYIFCLRWMHANGHLDDPPPEKLLFLYEDKSTQAAKEFTVPYDEAYLETFLEKRAKLDLDSPTPPECTGGSGCLQCKGLV